MITSIKNHIHAIQTRLGVILLIVFSIFFNPSQSQSADVIGPEVSFHGDEIHASASVVLDEKYINELKKGITKNFKIYVDIYRVWHNWPDEFISGKVIFRTLKCDPVKGEYIATSSSGNIFVNKRFKSFESMTDWALRIDDIRLIPVSELEPGTYYIRVTVESKIRKLPPVIGYFMIFLSENEFKIHKNSSFFYIGIKR
ncbi:MAG: DUF4390 domain-containing protein [Nitrospirae bacterium]|nr:DUF4390 domain-containing protein [Nitrospirota bacterium]